MPFSNIANTLQADTMTIETEVTEQLALAHRRIGAWDIAREYANMHLQTMPTLFNGNLEISYTDDRGDQQDKYQSRNLTLWCIAIQATIEQGNTSYNALAALFEIFAKDELGISWAEEPRKKTASVFVESMIEQGILNKKLVEQPYTKPDGTMGKSRVAELSEEFKLTLEAVKATLVDRATMVMKPLKNRPADWVDASNGIGEDANVSLISNSKLKTNEVAQPVLDAVNKLQGVAFIVSPAIAKEAFNMIANRNASIPTEELSMYTEVMKYKKGDYHFPVTMDNRGRIYYRGGILSPQGTDFCKAAFQFANFVALGEDGIEGLAIHTANVLGFDKLSIDSRIELLTSWMDSHTFDSIKNTKTLLEVFPSASKFQGLVAVLECKRLFTYLGENDSPVEFESNLVCHQDGTCNGLQHMAAITGDRQTAESVNCTAASTADLPTDIYGLVANEAEELAESDQLKELIAKYNRDMAKNPVMITGYGAGKETVKTNTAEYLKKNEGTAKHGKECGQLYIDAIGNVASAVHNLTNVIKLNVGFAIDEGQKVFTWQAADGFNACTKYINTEGNTIRAGAFSAKVPALKAKTFDKVKTLGAMAPNFIHSIDSAHLRMTVNACDHDLVTVHDSIGSHAGNYWKTSRAIREQFVAVHSYDALGNLCENMGQYAPDFEGDYQAEEALNAPYIFS